MRYINSRFTYLLTYYRNITGIRCGLRELILASCYSLLSGLYRHTCIWRLDNLRLIYVDTQLFTYLLVGRRIRRGETPADGKAVTRGTGKMGH